MTQTRREMLAATAAIPVGLAIGGNFSPPASPSVKKQETLIPIGIKELDESMGGGFPAGSSIAFCTDKCFTNAINWIMARLDVGIWDTSYPIHTKNLFSDNKDSIGVGGFILPYHPVRFCNRLNNSSQMIGFYQVISQQKADSVAKVNWENLEENADYIFWIKDLNMLVEIFGAKYGIKAKKEIQLSLYLMKTPGEGPRPFPIIDIKTCT